MPQFGPDALLETGLGNLTYVRRLWAAFAAGGVSAMAGLAPPDVRWGPLDVRGRPLHGTRQLAEFWDGRGIEVPSLRMFHHVGDDVVVEAEYGDDGEVERTVWVLFRFHGDRLVEAIAYPDEPELLACGPAAAIGWQVAAPARSA